MHAFIHNITDWVATKKGIIITLGIWLGIVLLLSLFAPNANHYAVNNVAKLYPDTSPSVIAQDKIDTYFSEDDGIPALLVLETDQEKIDQAELTGLAKRLSEADIRYVKRITPVHQMPIEALSAFLSKDGKAAFLPVLFQDDITSKEIKEGLADMEETFAAFPDLDIHVTGPAGIAVDATDLFSRADLVLLFSTVGIILILLILTYRSPLLAVIPILAAVFVYAVADRILGMIGFAGVELAKQSLSIMMVLLYAVVIDYSLFIFSRFREELLKTNNKYEAMRQAMRKIGIPIFYSGSTIFLTMLVLFVAEFGDYANFAPIFSAAILVVMIAALTLVPALFTLFGRKAFWPKIPRVGGKEKSTASLWLKIGHVVSRKPILSTCVMILFLLVAGSQVFLIKYEYNTMKSFPNDMPSRVGYDILEEKFSKGTLASTTVIFESEGPVGDKKLQKLKGALQEQPTVDTVRLSNKTKDDTVVQYALTFKEDPYNVKALDALEEMMRHEGEIMADAEVQGDLYFAGETAASVDNRNINFRDLIVIVFAETLLVFAMLILLTKSIKVSGIMMGTILLSFVAALGLGNLLSGYLFDVHAISNRVPVYAFVFLVALGIDYNIFLVTRFFEEKRRLAVKDAVASAVAHTGGIISSAGIILAATFAVLMTQPVEVLSTFGFIVALGILMDTFLIRGILLPGLLVLVEKNEHIRLLKKRK